MNADKETGTPSTTVDRMDIEYHSLVNRLISVTRERDRLFDALSIARKERDAAIARTELLLEELKAR